MKKIVIFLLAFLISTQLTSCSYDAIYHQQGNTRIYSLNYIEKYEETLNAMFQNNWRVLNTEEKSEEIKYSHFEQYTQWTLQYFDGNGEEKQFLLHNRSSFAEQLVKYIEDLAASYYDEQFFQPYLKEIPLTSGSYVYAFFEEISIDPMIGENEQKTRAISKYRRGLDRPESTICLSNLTPANLFKLCPVYINIQISISTSSMSEEEKQALEESTRIQVEKMIDAMCQFTDQTVNVELSVVSDKNRLPLYDGKNYWGWYYVGGRSVSLHSPAEYEHEIFNHYSGLFW